MLLVYEDVTDQKQRVDTQIHSVAISTYGYYAHNNRTEYIFDQSRKACHKRSLHMDLPNRFAWLAHANNNGTCKSATSTGTLWSIPRTAGCFKDNVPLYVNITIGDAQESFVFLSFAGQKPVDKSFMLPQQCWHA